jgi:hypothetical protein
MRNRVPAEEGSITLYGIILLVVILVTLTAFTLLVYPSYDSGTSAYSRFQGTADTMVLIGGMTGYADNSGLLGLVTVENPSPNPKELGAVQLKIRLDSVRLIIDPSSGVNLDESTVTFVYPRVSEKLPETSSFPMRKPGWTIAAKSGTLPYQSADADNILEPNEEFTLFVYPTEALPPRTPFSVIVAFANSKEIQANGFVPAPVTPAMNFQYVGRSGPL